METAMNPNGVCCEPAQLKVGFAFRQNVEYIKNSLSSPSKWEFSSWIVGWIFFIISDLYTALCMRQISPFRTRLPGAITQKFAITQTSMIIDLLGHGGTLR
jgi:hypothetical protein